MCPLQALAFQPPTLAGLSRKVEGRAGGSLWQHVPFPAQPASLPALRSRAAAVPWAELPADQGEPRGSLPSGLAPEGKPHLSLKMAPQPAVPMQWCRGVPETLTEKVDEPIFCS